ncbi:hypothetical protein Gotur_007829, partial [Gossypium turneri]
MFLIANMWMQFIYTQILPSQNVSNIKAFRENLLDAILQRHQDLFPHLVMAVCKRTKVHMSTTEHFVKSKKSIIGDLMCTQYVEAWHSSAKSSAEQINAHLIPQQSKDYSEKEEVEEEEEDEEEEEVFSHAYDLTETFQMIQPSTEKVSICNPRRHNPTQSAGRLVTKTA